MKHNLPRSLLFIALAAFFSTASYLLASYLVYRTGYPLDDAWIYQTYARNLSQFGEWSFIPGMASGGSTGPLWVLFIVAGYIIRIDHQIWSYILGSVTLFGIGMVGIQSFGRLQPKLEKWGIIAGLILVLEWHLIWASVSGMETLLSALIATFILVFLLKPDISSRQWLFIGFLIGISVWIRPDGITLLGPAGLVALLSSQTSIKQKLIKVLLLNIRIYHTVWTLPGFQSIYSWNYLAQHFLRQTSRICRTQGYQYHFSFLAAICYTAYRDWDCPVTWICDHLLPIAEKQNLARYRKHSLVLRLSWPFRPSNAGYLSTWQIHHPSHAHFLHFRHHWNRSLDS